uniref:Integrase catalytic domain-containing protein n=1 Tax=Meloidogyne hapla TaxID=6305 RepID=A0A1I8BFS9_MELHA
MGLEEVKTVLWSDSEIALSWIGSNERQPVFIANRLKEIRKNNMIFRHVGTASNPADLATRGIKAKELEKAQIWWFGPSWLKNEKEWPQKPITPPIDEGEEFIAQFALPKQLGKKMLMSIMFILRFVKSLLTLKAHSFKNKHLEKFSTANQFCALDFRIAEIIAIKEAQSRSMLSSNEKIKKEFMLFEDYDGLWRSKSRLQWSSLPRDSIEPIFLPKDDKLTPLIVLSLHNRYFHSGVQLTHYYVVQKFCGVTKRSIRKILGKCLECKRRKTLPYSLPPFPPYPIERMQKSPVFANIGLDYLGPTLVTMPDNSKHKLWVLLITCLATRAVWLDSVLDLSAKTFLNALRRFMAKRGRPSYILSDNATNFHLTAKTLDEIWGKIIKSPETINFAAKEKITWKFIVPLSCWEGGAYERLCGLAKNAFKRAIGKRILPLDEMNTVISEVEGILNSRPLVSMDDNPDSVRTLRPFDFLLESGQPGLPPIEKNEDDEWKNKLNAPEKLLNIYQNSLRIQNKFWLTWQHEYLNFLKERRQQHHKQRGNNILPRIGEVVLITDQNTPRAEWRIGRISELPPGDPTSIRSASVLMTNGKRLKRALAHLVPLEIGGSEETVPKPKETQNESEKERIILKREAKEKAKQKINANAHGLKALPFLILCLQIIALTNAKNLRTSLLPYECEEEGHLLHIESNCNSRQCCSSTNTYVIYEHAKLAGIEPPEQIETDNDISVLVPTIELFNGNKHYVRQLQLRTIDVFDKDEVCFGKGATIGTPHYCSVHDCVTAGTRFCYYPHREVTLFITKNSEIPIKAWGYTHLHINATNKKAMHCTNCKIKCVLEGIQAIFDEEKFAKMEICCQPYCFSFEGAKSPKRIILPKDLLLNEHTCSMQLWTTKSDSINKIIAKCTGKNICKLIDCYICTELLANPECWPIYAAIIGGILIAIAFTCTFKLCLLLNKAFITITELIWCIKVTSRIIKFSIKILIKMPYLILQKIIATIRKNKNQQKRQNNQNECELAEIKIKKQREFKPFIPFKKRAARGKTMTKIV